jgi:hypothetical protein
MIATLVLSLAIFGQGKKPPAEYTYGFYSRYNKEADEKFRSEWPRSWKLFADALGFPDSEVPPLRRIERGSPGHFWLYESEANHKRVADCHNRSCIRIYIKAYISYNEDYTGKVIAHELGHLLYDLQDQYPEGGGKITETEPNCIMGDFVKHGWSGKFCESCRLRILRKGGRK